MHRARAVVLVGVASFLALVALAGPAGAEQTFPTADACIEGKPFDVDVMSWRCASYDGEKTWIGTGSGTGDRLSPPGGSSLVVILIVVGVLWSLVPFGIAVSMANGRGESIGGAVLLTLLLGWVGVGITWYGQGRARKLLDEA